LYCFVFVVLFLFLAQSYPRPKQPTRKTQKQENHSNYPSDGSANILKRAIGA
jgi:hypothetical protein